MNPSKKIEYERKTTNIGVKDSRKEEF